jgi:hypothetical protein
MYRIETPEGIVLDIAHNRATAKQVAQRLANQCGSAILYGDDMIGGFSRVQPEAPVAASVAEPEADTNKFTFEVEFDSAAWEGMSEWERAQWVDRVNSVLADEVQVTGVFKR